MPLVFGTAGIRGPLGPGPDQMNSATVRRVTAGLASYLSDRVGRATPARVVIGYDARHRSDAFALDTVDVLTAAGHDALLLPRALPTPVLAFAVRHLEADAGVMVTASHNPATDNGYKVYLGGRLTDEDGRGAQIAPPVDAEIQARIDAADVPSGRGSPTTLGDDIEEAYVRAVAATLDDGPAASGRRAGVRIVLTPVHGVGGATAVAALAAAGFTDVTLVAEQAEPDPRFPTAPLPNPEEPGVMDRALALADATGAHLALALDPDADRCAVGTPLDGRWTRLGGDRVGCLLAERVARRLAAGDALPGVPEGARVLASSIVSSRMLAAIADAHGLAHASTLTGFKWIARVPGLAYGYEEALGYCVAPDIVRDKDGISAALAVAEAVAELAAEGRTLEDALDDLDAAYGVHASHPHACRVPDPERALAWLAAHPPSTLGGRRVVDVESLDEGRGGLPPTPGLRLVTDDDTRVVIRPSGTEAKTKVYVEVRRDAGGDVAEARRDASALASHVASDVEDAVRKAVGRSAPEPRGRA